VNRNSILLWLALASPGTASAALCTPDLVPAATLLVPYVQYCGAGCDRDSRVVVMNSGAAPRLARVTLWSNAAVPVLTFDLYLQGFAQQEFLMSQILTTGTLPVSGVGVSEPGGQAQAEQNFPGCNAGSDPAGGAPVYGVGALDAAERAALDAALRGQPDPVSGMCSALPRADGIRTGYVTVDVVDRCNAPRAGQPGFAAALAPDNVLLGRVELVHLTQNFQSAMPAVAIEAAGAGQLAGNHTFYRFDGISEDDREPLPTSYVYSQYQGGVFAHDHSVLIWRGVGTVQTPFACGSAPAWYPLNFANRHGFGTSGGIVIDENGRPTRLRVHTTAGLATQPPFEPVLERTHEEVPSGANALYYNLQHSADGGQAWLGSEKTTQGRFRSIEQGASLDSSCRGTPFDNLSPGLAPPLPVTP
jgi:hypothetical protein